MNTGLSAFISAAGGSGGNDFAKGKKLINEGINGFSIKSAKGIHPTIKKAAEKSYNTAVRYIKNSFFDGLGESFVYDAINFFSSLFAGKIMDRAFGR